MKSDSEWRDKYLEAVDRLESSEAEWKKLDSVLRTLTSRLCLAAQGRDGRLDDELRRVSERVRAQADSVELVELIGPLSQAIAALDAGPAPIAHTTTQRIPPSAVPAAGASPVDTTPGNAVIAPTGAQGAATSTPSAGAARPGNAATTKASAQSMALDSLGAEPAASSAPPRAASDADSSQRVRSAAVAATLKRLSSLPELQPALESLHEKPASQITADELATALQNLTAILGEQRSRLQREKLEVEGLLTQMNSRLEEIAGHLASDAAHQKTARDSSQHLNSLVMGEVHEITTTVQRASDLGELRKQVSGRLDAISAHFQEFRAREDERVRAQVQRSERMRARITELERESRVLQETLKHEQRTALLDALTGIPNRAAYDERVEADIDYWKKTKAPMSVLAWDLDGFKGINDQYGHKAGDKVLRVIGQYLAQQVRGTDFVARYGGEEFVMILAETNLEQAAVVADKIRVGISSLGFHFRNSPVTVTASCGITEFRNGDSADSAFERADQALYRAKDSGRNRCVA